MTGRLMEALMRIRGGGQEPSVQQEEDQTDARGSRDWRVPAAGCRCDHDRRAANLLMMQAEENLKKDRRVQVHARRLSSTLFKNMTRQLEAKTQRGSEWGGGAVRSGDL